MNYREYLEGLNLESLKILTDVHGIDYMNSLEWTGNEVSLLKAEILKKLADSEYLSKLINDLDDYQKNIIRIIFFSDEAVDQDSVIRKFNNLYGKEYNARNVIDALWRMGLLIKFEMYYRNRPYVILADETRLTASRLIVQELLGQWEGKELETYINSNPFELSQDIYAFLSYVNNNEIRLTAKNAIFRKSAQKIEDLFVIKSDFMDEPESEYTERFLLINNFLYMIDMIIYNEGMVYLNGEKVSKWLKMKLVDKISAVSNFVETYYLGNKREITEAVNKIKLILLNTYDTPIKLVHIEELINKYHADMNFSYFNSNYKKILYHMAMIGMIEILKDGEDNQYFRLNKYGWAFYSSRTKTINEEEEKHFYIQPNFEIIATINLDPVLRWEIDEFCDIGKIEKTIHYWITKSSIHRAMSNNKSIENILAFLKTYSKSGVPQNVEYSLIEWAASYGNVSLVDIILLRCRTGNLAQEMLSIPAVSQNIIGKVTEKDLIINRTSLEDVMDVLVKRGYLAKPQIADSVENGFADSKKHQDENVYVKVDLSKQKEDNDININQFTIDARYIDQSAHYKKTVMNIKPPAKGEAVKGIASKIYSPSTFQAKDIIERAIEQKKPVLIDYYSQLEDSSSQIRIEPFKVQRENDRWIVHANAKDQSMLLDIDNIQSIEFSNNN